MQSTKHQQQQPKQPKPDGENENGNVVAGGWWETKWNKNAHEIRVSKRVNCNSSAFAVAHHLRTHFFFFLCLFSGWVWFFFFFGGFFCFECTEKDNASSFSVVEIIVMQLLLWPTNDKDVSHAIEQEHTRYFRLFCLCFIRLIVGIRKQSSVCLQTYGCINTIKTAQAAVAQQKRRWQIKILKMVFTHKRPTRSIRFKKMGPDDQRDEVRACDLNLQNRLRDYYYSIFVGRFVFIFLWLATRDWPVDYTIYAYGLRYGRV